MTVRGPGVLASGSLALALRGADLAAVAGDTDDEARLLEIAAKEIPELLSPAERLVLARQAEARGDRRCGDGCLGSRGCRTGRRSHRPSR
jgi:hypothetical protein